MCVVGDEVFVTDCINHRLQVLSKQGEFLRTIGSQAQFKYPYGLCLHAGELIVADCSNHRICVVDPVSGQTLRTFGKEGQGDGEFNRPVGVAVLQGKLFEWDNHRLLVFS